MYKKVNQEFLSIPNAAIKNRIEQLANQYGIKFITQEESYTSKSNFLGNDELPTFGEKSERKHMFIGKRGQGFPGFKSQSLPLTAFRGKKIKGKLNNLGRGGYLTSDGIWLNSDCLGAANLLCKKNNTAREYIFSQGY
jgi:putative transposase